MKKLIFLTDFKQREFQSNLKNKARDFFYGIDLLENNFKIKIYDIGKFRTTKNIFTKIISKFSFFLTGIYGIISIDLIKFFKRIPNKSIIICANDGIGICCLVINLFLKKEFKVFILSMGFYSKYFLNKKNTILLFIRKKIINILLFKSKKILFLGERERYFFMRLFKNHAEKSFFFKFRIDDEFWSKKEKIKISKNPYILFIGNDNYRDYEMIFKIVKKYPNIKFKIISNKFKNLYKVKLKNLEVIGFKKNDSYKLSDLKLRKIIKQSHGLILPIKNTLQPSGQSVALQAIACKRPVAISNYDGFWDKEKMIGNKNCFLMDQNADEEDWGKVLKYLIIKNKNHNKMTKNAFSELIKKSPYNNYLNQWLSIINDF